MLQSPWPAKGELQRGREKSYHEIQMHNFSCVGGTSNRCIVGCCSDSHAELFSESGSGHLLMCVRHVCVACASSSDAVITRISTPCPGTPPGSFIVLKWLLQFIEHPA